MAPVETARTAARPPGTRAASLSPEQRRASIVAAARPLLAEHGAAVTTRQIAEAAGIAEGTIFRVFPDKDSLLRAVVEAAADAAPVEQALAAIDVTRPLDEQLAVAVDVMQRRLRDIWQLSSALGMPSGPPKTGASKHGARPVFAGLTAIFAAHREQISTTPVFAAEALRALTLAMTHPAIAPHRPPKPREIVALFLDGARRRTEDPSC